MPKRDSEGNTVDTTDVIMEDVQYVEREPVAAPRPAHIEHAPAERIMAPSPAIAGYELLKPGTVKKMVDDIKSKITAEEKSNIEKLDYRSRGRDSSVGL